MHHSVSHHDERLPASRRRNAPWRAGTAGGAARLPALRPWPVWLILPILLTLLPMARARAAPELRIVVDGSTAMPMSQISNGVLTGGIHHAIGVALAGQLGTTARFTPLPRKRIGVTLEQGAADLVCHMLPAWLPGAFDWSVPFMPNATLLISAVQWQAPVSLDDVRGVPVGTVLGFAYPEIQHALGAGFVRDDAVDALHSLTKFAAGRTRHALTGEVFFTYQQRLHPTLLQVHRPILVTRFNAQCAVSRRGRYSVQQVDAAIVRLQKSGRIEAIYASFKQK